MPAISTFQRLPLHIAAKIARFFYFSRLLDHSNSGTYIEERHVWTMLYNVSYSWRLLALHHFFENVLMDVDAVSGIGQLRFYNLPNGIIIDTPHYNYVKRVSVNATLAQEPSNTTPFRDLSFIWPDTTVFPSALLLDICIDGLLYQMVDINGSTENERFYWITKRIQTCLPNLQQVSIVDRRLGSLENLAASSTVWKADELLSTIYSKVAKLHIWTQVARLSSDCLLGLNGTGLVHLECNLTNNSKLLRFIIHNSVSTLESLKYYDEYFATVASLLSDNNGTPIIYPRLRRLEFYNSTTPGTINKIRVNKSVAPFPGLRYLKWKSAFIFDDDTLFRENFNLLEHLDIDIDTGLANILQRHKVFNSSKGLQLRYVSVRRHEGSAGIKMGTAEFVRSAVNLIAPTTQYFVIYHPELREIAGTVATSQHLGNLRSLHLSSFKGTLRELIQLVRLLPNMTNLTCSPGAVDFGPDSTHFREYISGHFTDFRELKHSFRRWKVLTYANDDNTPVAQTALAFAILCENFKLVFLRPRCRIIFECKLKGAIESGFYDEHVEKIQRLIRYTR